MLVKALHHDKVKKIKQLQRLLRDLKKIKNTIDQCKQDIKDGKY